MDIKLLPHMPVVKKPYNIPIPKQCVVEEICGERVVAFRHNSKVKFIVCITCRVGTETERRRDALSKVSTTLFLATLSGKKIFTTLVFMSGFCQIEVEDSKLFTAFAKPGEYFEFNRMPFGSRNAPCAFQKMMPELIEPLRKSVVSCVDEVIKAIDTEEENLFYFE